MGRPDRPLRGPVPDGPGPVGDERLDLPAGRRLRHYRDHDPGRDHALRPGHGGADAHRRQARGPVRAAAGVRHRAGDLRRRLGPDRGFLERPHADARLVGARGDRCRDGVAGARRLGRRHLQRTRPGDGLRSPRRGRGRGYRGRSDPRRLADDEPHVAARVRGRGGPRDRDPAVRPAVARALARGGAPGARLGWLGAFGARAEPDRLRGASGEQLGVAGAARLTRRTVRVRADAVRDRRRRARAVGLSSLGAPPRGGRQASRSCTSDCSAFRSSAEGWSCSWPRT